MHWTDQRGERIPDDLVLLPDPRYLSRKDFVAVFAVDWYDTGGYILASACALDCLSGMDPADAGLDLPAAEITYVADALKRGSEEEGFYHA